MQAVEEPEAIGMAETPRIERDIGRLEARADSTDERLERIESKMDLVLEYMAASKGAWKMLIGVGTAAATVAAGLTEAIHWIWGGRS